MIYPVYYLNFELSLISKLNLDWHLIISDTDEVLSDLAILHVLYWKCYILASRISLYDQDVFVGKGHEMNCY